MKVFDLEGALLDYWAAQADEAWKTAHELYPAMTLDPTFKGVEIINGVCMLLPTNPYRQNRRPYDPSVSWWIGGPIIERERIDLAYEFEWSACHDALYYSVTGPTPLIAAMRAYVASKFGEEVPDESCTQATTA